MAGQHPRNTAPMTNSLRCGAKTRKGTPCRAPAVAGKLRCRMHACMHGGAAGSGAPKGNSNALKHGLYTADAKEMRRHIRELCQNTKDIIDDI